MFTTRGEGVKGLFAMCGLIVVEATVYKWTVLFGAWHWPWKEGGSSEFRGNRDIPLRWEKMVEAGRKEITTG